MTQALRLFYFAVAVVFASAPTLSLAAEQGAAKNRAIVVTDSVSAKVTVVGIKKKEHELKLRNEQGEEVDVIVPKEVRNFPQIKKGDIIEVEYHLAAATQLEKVSETNAAGEATVVERAPAGAKPGAWAMHTQSIVATVLEIDAANRLLRLQGPKGGIVSVKVPADMKSFDGLKKGDKVSAVYTEAVAISVKEPPKKK